MITEQHIDMAHKFYSARKAMKFLHGDNYQAKVDETKPIVEKFMAAGKCGPVEAVTAIVTQINKKFYGDQAGLLTAMILATVVEMTEAH